MKIIKTKSLELAIFTKGNPDSQKLVILIPGRLDTKDYASFVSHADYLSEKGLFIVAFDPPGTWESPGDTSLVTTTNYIKAINELIEYFGNKPTILLGHSRGATSAILASMHNSLIKGIISINANLGDPSSPSKEDLQRGFHLSGRDLPPGTSKTEKKKEFKLSLNYWEDGKKYNTKQSLKECTKPKLIIFGNEDEFTSPREVKELYDLIPEPKTIKEVHSIHDYRYFPEVIKEINQEVEKFLVKYIN